MGKDLIIVESPTKARTIGRILGDQYALVASMGHVRDLPSSRLGVAVTENFAPEYLVPLSKRNVVAEVKRLAREATTTYLATDPDREGESISWHLARAAQIPDSNIKRVVFHEITPQAVKEAFQKPRTIDLKLVNAQQARRILDRLVGYLLSPLISKKLRWWGLSAGRVQSAALRMVSERDQEIENFRSREYWTISVQLGRGTPSQEQEGTADKNSQFVAELHSRVGNRARIQLATNLEATLIQHRLEGASYFLRSLKVRKVHYRPTPPFITSTLQQEAWRKLRFPSRKTMNIAQQLYEGIVLGDEGSIGLITYMRTDSTRVSEVAIAEVRQCISRDFGNSFLPKQPRVYKERVKGAQEAHEAIRPSSPNRSPAKIRKLLNSDQYRLYDLIWKRFVASQMADCLAEAARADVQADCGDADEAYLLRATGTIITFPGFRVLYQEDQDTPEVSKQEHFLPSMSDNEALHCLEVNSGQHFTKPPAHYTEASLVGAMEEMGIGRPSTYASIISTIHDRGYVRRDRGNLSSLPLGKAVNELLTEYFSPVLDLGFTAQMEEALDEIAQGKQSWQEVLNDFYLPFAKVLEEATTRMPLVDIPADESCEICGRPMVLKRNRRSGSIFVSCGGYPECRNAKPLQVKLGVGCPSCGAELVQRKGSRGRRQNIFYGCSSYPTCTFTLNRRPLQDPCPECSGLTVQKGRRGTSCTVCSFEGQIDEREPIMVGATDGT